MTASRALLLPHTPSSVAVARQRLCHELLAQGVADQTVADAALVVSELLGNALRHARPLRSGRVRVTWRLDDERLQIAVSDGGAGTEPRMRPRSLTSPGGRGLEIVEHVANEWGVRHEGEATTVWAKLSAQAAAVASV
ncbi:MAG: ATP-binding protein [Streptosporangiales bacterium]|nr:ATP-binding protein [Streptosporangiales bacterium]